MIDLKIEYLSNYNYELWGPLKYARKGDACFDLRAAINGAKILYGNAGIMKVPTGIIAEIPEGYEMRISPRSGMAAKYGISMVNTPGVVDSYYRDEISIILINHGTENFVIAPGMRIGQAKISIVPAVNIVKVDSIDMHNNRGGGFGHTGDY